MDQITDPVAAKARKAIEDSPLSLREIATYTHIPYTTLHRRRDDGTWTLAELRRLSAVVDTDLLEGSK